MSKLEETVIFELKDAYKQKTGNELNVETKKRLYDFDESIPWSNRNYIVPDIFLSDFDLFIEIKGIMTIEQMMKINWITNRSKKPYCLIQATEEDWLIPFHKSTSESKREKVERNFFLQINEIIDFLTISYANLFRLNEFTIERIESFLDYKLCEYDRVVWRKEYDDGIFGPFSSNLLYL